MATHNEAAMNKIKARLSNQGIIPGSSLLLLAAFCLVLVLPIEITTPDEFISDASALTIDVEKLHHEAVHTAKPGPFSVEELQASLSSFDSSTAFSTIGNYPLGSFEKDLLGSVVGAIEEQSCHVGFVLMDINTGWGVAYNADEEFYSASSIKGPYVASLAVHHPDSVLSWAESMYSVVHDSDNDEYFSLRNSYGDEPMTWWCEEAGVEAFIDGEWFPYCSPRTLSKLWLRTYEYFESDSAGTSEIKSMYIGSLNSPISQNLGATYEVCTKAGWIIDEEFTATIDAGIVYAGENPYLMIIMTDAPSDFSVLDPLVLALDEIHEYFY